MADPDVNPLFNDVGINPAATPAPTNALLDDVGTKSGTDWSGSDGSTPAKATSKEPVTDEAKQAAANILKQLPRNAVDVLGKVADIPGDIWDLAFHPDGDGDGEIGQGLATGAADALEGAVPSLKPTNQGSLERVVGQGIEGAGLGALTGPLEGVLPTAISGAASQTAKESGLGPVAQTVAGLTPFAPSLAAAGVRGLVRGGAAGGEAMRGTIADADAAGLKVSVGQASGNPIIKGAESLSSRLPGGGPLAETRNMNAQVEHSVSEIQKTIDPNYDEHPHTPREAGEEIEEGAKNSIEKGKQQTTSALQDLNDAVGGEDQPMAAPKSQAALKGVTNPTGVPEVDNAIAGTKAKKAANVIDAVSNKPKTPTSYSTDGEGAHSVTSPNGETHAVETATGDLKVTRSDTSPSAQGKGEGTDRLETLAHAAAGKGANLVSDISVSPAESAAYEKLGNRGWTVTKNPGAEINPDTGNLVSDSPKNPVYSVSAPKAEGGAAGPNAPKSPNSPDTMDWTYDPATGKSEPVTNSEAQGPKEGSGITPELNQDTPWTFKSFRALRTQVGRALRTATGNDQLQLSTLYGSMSEDLKNFVKSKGSDAEQKYEFFNSVAKTNGDQRKVLEKAIKNEGGPGEIFRKAMSGSQDDAEKISRVMGAMDSDGQNTFRSVVLHRMGRVAGGQTAPFNANTFLTNWDKMSQEAKNALFGASKTTGPLRTSLDALTKSLGDMKAGGMLKSGLGTELARAGTGVAHGVGLVATLLALKEVGSPIAHLAEGHPFMAAGTAASMGAAVLANPVMSRVLTNPKVVSWLAQATKAPKGMAPVLMNQLNQMAQKDPDAKGLSGLIDNLPTGSQTAGGASAPQVTNNGQKLQDPTQTGMSDDRPITNSHKMVPMKSPSGSTFYGVDPATFDKRG